MNGIAVLIRLTVATEATTVYLCCGGGGGSETPSAGNLTIAIIGLPNGVSGAVTVTGPSGFSQTVGASQMLSGLTAGTYTVSAANVLVGVDIHSPQLSNQAVAVSV